MLKDNLAEMALGAGIRSPGFASFKHKFYIISYQDIYEINMHDPRNRYVFAAI